MPFIDRTDAGRRLAARLTHLRGEDVVVLGLPRGGVPVAAEVAAALGAPLDVIVVRKVGVPFQPELAMGAVGEGGVVVRNDDVISLSAVTEAELGDVAAREQRELQRRVAGLFRAVRPRLALAGKVALVVDDGLATGATARAACRVARAAGAARVVLAVPVAPAETVAAARSDADAVVCVETPRSFFGVGEWYKDFSQVTDDEVVALLRRAVATDCALDEHVEIEVGALSLPGHLHVPDGASGIVVFAHGSGSSRHSPRNRYVASILQEAGIGTLLFDLLTPAEELNRANVFDIELLATRLSNATRWVRAQPLGRDAGLGLFGASTGAGAALWAAAEPGAKIAAVVSRGGRPDLAGRRLAAVRAPTLLVVGGNDPVVLDLNREAQAQMQCETRLEVVPGASHLFEEPGTLPRAAQLATAWFAHHLQGP